MLLHKVLSNVISRTFTSDEIDYINNLMQNPPTESILETELQHLKEREELAKFQGEMFGLVNRRESYNDMDTTFHNRHKPFSQRDKEKQKRRKKNKNKKTHRNK